MDFRVSQGEFVSVIGPSGAGKTTLFRILNGMMECTGGQVLLDDKRFDSLKGRKKRELQKSIATIYQDFCLVENSTCLKNVLTAGLPDMGFFQGMFGLYGKTRKEEALKLLDRLDFRKRQRNRLKICLADRNSVWRLQGHLCGIRQSCWQMNRWRPR